MDEGLLIVISGPSGSGKGTICKELKDKMKELKVSVSVTTRKPRPGEVDGLNYYFVEEGEFIRRRESDDFLESACVYGNFYGTPKSTVLKELKSGKDIILEIDIQGALTVKKNYPDGVFIFILPPSLSELRHRIEGRGTDSKDVIFKRMECACDELSYAFKYDYVVLNDEINKAVGKIESIISAEKNKAHRNAELINRIREV